MTSGTAPSAVDRSRAGIWRAPAGHSALLLVLALIATAPGSSVRAAQGADANPVLNEIMGLLAERRHGHVSFVEKQFLALLDRPLESSGELFYDAPDRLEKRTLRPKPEDLVLEHGIVSAHRGRRTYTLDLRSYPEVVPFIDSLRATLAGDRAALERLFHVEAQGNLDEWQLILTPREASVAGKLDRIRIEGAGRDIHTVSIQQTDGDRSLLSIGPEISP